MRKFFIAKGYEDKDVFLPKRATKNSAGYDLCTIEDASIAPNEIRAVDTGVKCKMNDDEFFLIFPRSSLAKRHGLRLANTAGVIDADFFGNGSDDGHIRIHLYNFSNHVAHIKKGERLVQGIFIKYLRTDDDDATADREGGLGSTGKI